jgi:hypothetical protein
MAWFDGFGLRKIAANIHHKNSFMQMRKSKPLHKHISVIAINCIPAKRFTDRDTRLTHAHGPQMHQALLIVEHPAPLVE